MAISQEEFDYLSKPATRYELVSTINSLERALIYLASGLTAEDAAGRQSSYDLFQDDYDKLLSIRRALVHQGTDPETGFQL